MSHFHSRQDDGTVLRRWTEPLIIFNKIRTTLDKTFRRKKPQKLIIIKKNKFNSEKHFQQRNNSSL